MCGITGFLSKNLIIEHLVKMTQQLAHRGPDSEGYFFDHEKNIGLGNRRLSILDLSESANIQYFIITIYLL